MSLDNTSHPGRPGPDELVPSRYALRVGEIDVLVVSDGVLSLPGAMLAHNAAPAVRAAWLKDMFLPPRSWIGKASAVAGTKYCRQHGSDKRETAYSSLVDMDYPTGALTRRLPCSACLLFR